MDAVIVVIIAAVDASSGMIGIVYPAITIVGFRNEVIACNIVIATKNITVTSKIGELIFESMYCILRLVNWGRCLDYTVQVHHSARPNLLGCRAELSAG